MRSAHADSWSTLAGRHKKSRRRLGVSPGPVALNGPVTVTDTTDGKAPRLRPGGRRGASDSASLRSTNATPTLRGPAGTAKRKAPLFGGASSPTGTPGLLETFVMALRSPSILISS